MSISQKLQSLGSSPRSSEGIYNKTSSLFSNKSATPSSKSATPSKSSSLFSNKPSVSRLMNAPVETVTGAVADANAPPSLVKPNGGSFWRYFNHFSYYRFSRRKSLALFH